MAVRIRMSRLGKTNMPFFRIGVYESKERRNGRCIENLGWYNPVSKKDDDMEFNIERIKHWYNLGARPTPKVATLLKKAGIKLVEPPKPSEKPKGKKKKSGKKSGKKK